MNSGSPTSSDSIRSSPCGSCEYFTETSPVPLSFCPHETAASIRNPVMAAHRQRVERNAFVFMAQ